MNCKLCGENLYRNLSFSTIFKWKMVMHPECEQQFSLPNDLPVFPYEHVMVEYGYLFPHGYQQSDRQYLYQTYMKYWLLKWIKEKRWSIMLELDENVNESDLPLVLGLGDDSVLLVTMFEEEVLKPDENRQ